MMAETPIGDDGDGTQWPYIPFLSPPFACLWGGGRGIDNRRPEIQVVVLVVLL